MKKYRSKQEIERAYNQKIGRAKQWYTTALRNFDAWLNVKTRDTSAVDNKEAMRQKCMVLAQENCKLQEAIFYESPMISCCTCGKKLRYDDPKMHGWHRESRRNKRVCIHPMNINPQCSTCNNPATKPKDEKEKYRQYLIKKYWESEYMKFEKLCWIKTTFSVPIDYWNKEYDRLLKENTKLKDQIKF